MNISARIESGFNHHEVTVETNQSAKSLVIPPKSTGYGSSVNGGELLVLALATCYCNDIYREAGKQNIPIEKVDVECLADFGAEGEPGSNFRYHVKITSSAPNEVIANLIRHTDSVAEIQNTLRKGVPVHLEFRKSGI